MQITEKAIFIEDAYMMEMMMAIRESHTTEGFNE